jgi:hypothetical protein
MVSKSLTDANARLFTAPNTWSGGFYELIIHLGRRSDQRLQQALDLLWMHDNLDGCWLNPDVEPADNRRIEPLLRNPVKLLGIAALSDTQNAACLSVIKRQKLTDGKQMGIAKPDWLRFGLPMGALATIYDVGTFPETAMWDHEARQWREKLDRWLVDIARHICKSVPYDFAMIGHELDEEELWRQLNNNDAPQSRSWGYLQGNLQMLDGDLDWHPPTTYG